MAGDRTEKPTQRRQDKARKEGQFPASRELLNALQLLVFVYLLTSLGDSLVERLRRAFRAELVLAFHRTPQVADACSLAGGMVSLFGVPLLACGSGLMVAVLCVQMAATRFGFAGEKLAPDFKRLNPVQRLRSLPGQNVAAFFQAVFLIVLFSVVVAGLARDNEEIFSRLPLMGIEGSWAAVRTALTSLLWKCAWIAGVIGLLQFVREKRRHMKGLRMSKQEVRDEVKETEGNPQIKARIRRIQRDLARRQMMKEIPTATAVIVNPTHYAVAIRYDMSAMSAPRVVAKGRNYLARRIREIAMSHQVPIVENQPLAQALYKHVDVGQEIPAHLYRAVAEILAYIYRLMQPKGRS
ncbi:MAG: EscU/YscU/HrcU family type III secretion system export apparatus switch protein [Bryobacteraceae bacterium]|jgi:flagellar biosynthesis protein FlhB